jgi:Toprim domain-containing protein/CHC2-type zinc finger protein
MSYSYRKPPIPAHRLEQARGASFIQAYQGLGLTLKRINASEMAGPCPPCGGTDRFSINIKLQVWNCRGCVKGGGDAISLLSHVRGLGFREAVEDLTGESDVERPALATVPNGTVEKPKAVDVAKLEAFILKMAAKTVARMVPIIGTPGEAYLCDVRKINTGALVDVLSVTDAIGWDPESFFREDGHPLDRRNLGCIVAIMTDPASGAPTGGVSRTYIHDGQKVAKAKGLGPAGIVRLSPDEDVTNGLHLAEGLETALAAMSKGLRPMWSTGSTAIMAKMPVVSGIECITILADHDENGAGEKAAHEAGHRWREAGRGVRVWTPPTFGDFNDLLMQGVL